MPRSRSTPRPACEALQISLLGLGAISLLAIVPATRMPGAPAGDLPEKLEPDDDDVIDEVDDTDQVADGADGADGVDDKEAVA